MVHVGELCIDFLLKPLFKPIQIGFSCKWTGDSKQFILENFDLIQDSPSQMYNSTLTLCPSSSWLYKDYFAGMAVVVGPAEWRTCIRTVSCQTRVVALAYWNNTIATGSLPQGIIIFDALRQSNSCSFWTHWICTMSCFLIRWYTTCFWEQ